MNVLLTGAYTYTNEDLKRFEDYGYKIFYLEREDQVDTSLIFKDEEIDAIICNWFFVYHDIRKFKRLKMIQLLSAGTDRVDVSYIREKGIRLETARGVYSTPMAEFVILRVLQLYKNTEFWDENQKKHAWIKNRNIKELSSVNVCILGCGNVGTEIAKKFSVFTDNVVGIDVVSNSTQSYFKEIYSIDKLHSQIMIADIIIVTLPLTDQTKNIIDFEEFDLMKKESILVNIARGGIVNEKALKNAVKLKKIGGAILDVFLNEPLEIDDALWDYDNVLISPHNSFVSMCNETRMREVIWRNFGLYEKK